MYVLRLNTKQRPLTFKILNERLQVVGVQASKLLPVYYDLLKTCVIICVIQRNVYTSTKTFSTFSI